MLDNYPLLSKELNFRNLFDFTYFLNFPSKRRQKVNKKQSRVARAVSVLVLDLLKDKLKDILSFNICGTFLITLFVDKFSFAILSLGNLQKHFCTFIS